MDAIIPSLLLKYAVSGCKSFMHKLFWGNWQIDDMKEHQLGAGNELEEHAFMMSYLNAPAMPLYLLPDCGDNPEFMKLGVTI